MSNYLSTLYQRVDTIRKYKPENVTELMKEFEVRRALEDDLLQAKRLHASVYLGRDFIKPEHVVDGMMSLKHDPYQQHATYFVVKAKTETTSYHRGEVVAVARQIKTTDEGLGSLPIMRHTKAKLNARLNEQYDYVEISALAKKRGINSSVLLLLFRAMLQHSRSEDHKIWLMACDERVYWRLKTLFPYSMRKIGPKTFYMGSYVIPTMVNLNNIQKSLNKAHLLSPPPLRKLRRGIKDVMLLNVLADL